MSSIQDNNVFGQLRGKFLESLLQDEQWSELVNAMLEVSDVDILETLKIGSELYNPNEPEKYPDSFTLSRSTIDLPLPFQAGSYYNLFKALVLYGAAIDPDYDDTNVLTKYELVDIRRQFDNNNHLPANQLYVPNLKDIPLGAQIRVYVPANTRLSGFVTASVTRGVSDASIFKIPTVSAASRSVMSQASSPAISLNHPIGINSGVNYEVSPVVIRREDIDPSIPIDPNPGAGGHIINNRTETPEDNDETLPYQDYSIVSFVNGLLTLSDDVPATYTRIDLIVNPVSTNDANYALSPEYAPASIKLFTSAAVSKMKSFVDFIHDTFPATANIVIDDEVSYWTINVASEDESKGTVRIYEKVQAPSNAISPVLDTTAQIRNGNSVILEALPAENYELDSWSIPGDSEQLIFTPSELSYSINIPIEITAKFRLKTWKVNVAPNLRNSIVVSGAGAYPIIDTPEITITVKPQVGYKVLEFAETEYQDGNPYVYLCGAWRPVVVDDTTNTLSVTFTPTSDVSLQVNTRPLYGYISIQQFVSANDAPGFLAPILGNTRSVLPQSTDYLTPASQKPLRVDVAILDYSTGYSTGELFTPRSYRSAIKTNARNESCKFLYWQYNRTHYEENDGEVTSTILMQRVYDFTKAYTLLFEQDNDVLDIEVYFQCDIPLTASFVSAGTIYGTVKHGLETPDKTGAANYPLGSVVKVEATASEYYEFDYWYTYGNDVTDEYGNPITITSPSITVVVKPNTVLVALYKPKKVSVVVSTSPSDGGTVHITNSGSPLANQCFVDNKAIDPEYKQPPLSGLEVFIGSRVVAIPSTLSGTLTEWSYYMGSTTEAIRGTSWTGDVYSQLSINATFATNIESYYSLFVNTDPDDVEYTKTVISGQESSSGQYLSGSVVRLAFPFYPTFETGQVLTINGINRTAQYNENGYIDITIAATTSVFLDLDASTGTLTAQIAVSDEYSAAIDYTPDNDFVSIYNLGEYSIGSVATLIAAPKEGSTFVAWFKRVGATVQYVSSNPTIEVTVTGNDIYLVRLTVASVSFLALCPISMGTVVWGPALNESGDVDVSVDGANSYNYPYGTSLYLQCKPATGHQFDRWSAYVHAATANPTTVKLLGNYSIEAQMSAILYVVAVSAGNHGVANIASGDYSYGTELTLSATPEVGYKVDKWYVNGQETADGSVIRVTSNTIISVSFIAHSITCNVLQSEGVSAIALTIGSTPLPVVSGQVSVPYGANVTVTVTALSDYQFVRWFDDSVGYSQPSENQYQKTFVITEAVDLCAVFAMGTVTVRVQAFDALSESHLQVTGGGDFLPGASVLLQANPDTGYEFVGWFNSLESDTPVSTQRYYQAYASATTYYAKCKVASLTLDVSIEEVEGHSLVLSNRPLTAQEIEDIKNALGSATYTYLLDSTAAALYDIRQRRLVSLETTEGTMAPTWHISADVSYGSVYYLYAIVYRDDVLPFFKWSNDNLSNPLALTMIESVNLVGTFSEEGYSYASLSAVCDLNQIMVSGEGRYIKGSTVDVTIAPIQGFCIRDIKINGSRSEGIQIPYDDFDDFSAESVTFSLPLDDDTIISVDSAPEQYQVYIDIRRATNQQQEEQALVVDCSIATISAASSDGTALTVTPVYNNSVIVGYKIEGLEYRDVIHITVAQTSDNTIYQFSSWSDGGDTRVRELVVNTNITLNAIFTQTIISNAAINLNPQLGTIFNAGTSVLAPSLIEVPYSGDKKYPYEHEPIGPLDQQGREATNFQNIRLRAEAFQYGTISEWKLFLKVPNDVLSNSANVSQMYSGVERSEHLNNTLAALSTEVNMFNFSDLDNLRQIGLVVIYYKDSNKIIIDYISGRYQINNTVSVITSTSIVTLATAVGAFNALYSELFMYANRGTVIAANFNRKTARCNIVLSDANAADIVPGTGEQVINLGQNLQVAARLINEYYEFKGWQTTPAYSPENGWDPVITNPLSKGMSFLSLSALFPATFPDSYFTNGVQTVIPTIAAIISAKTYTIPLHFEGRGSIRILCNGSVVADNVSTDTVITVPYNAQVAIIPNAAKGYTFSSVYYLRKMTTNPTFRITNVTASITVTFSSIRYKTLKYIVDDIKCIEGADIPADIESTIRGLIEPAQGIYHANSNIVFNPHIESIPKKYPGTTLSVISYSLTVVDTYDSRTIRYTSFPSTGVVYTPNNVDSVLECHIEVFLTDQVLATIACFIANDPRYPETYQFVYNNDPAISGIVDSNVVSFNNAGSSTDVSLWPALIKPITEDQPAFLYFEEFDGVPITFEQGETFTATALFANMPLMFIRFVYPEIDTDDVRDFTRITWRPVTKNTKIVPKSDPTKGFTYQQFVDEVAKLGCFTDFGKKVGAPFVTIDSSSCSPVGLYTASGSLDGVYFNDLERAGLSENSHIKENKAEYLAYLFGSPERTVNFYFIFILEMLRAQVGFGNIGFATQVRVNPNTKIGDDEESMREFAETLNRYSIIQYIKSQKAVPFESPRGNCFDVALEPVVSGSIANVRTDVSDFTYGINGGTSYKYNVRMPLYPMCVLTLPMPLILGEFKYL